MVRTAMILNAEEIRAALSSAAQAQREGRHDDAASLCHAVLDRAGDEPLALNMLGMQALARGDHTTAATMFQRALVADPTSPDLQMNLATAFRRSGNDVGERAALEGALAIDQRHFMALVRLAELLERTGELAHAAERWSGVLAMSIVIEERSPALDELLAHAMDFVTAQRASFANDVDAGLAASRSSVEIGERQRFDTCIDHLLGRRQIYPNICSGLHFPFLPAEEYFSRHHFPWFDQIEAQTEMIRSELEQLLKTQASEFTPYVAMEPGTPDNKWAKLDHKLDWAAFHFWKNGVRDDAACARCPKTAAAIEALPLAHLPGRAPTIFFSMLQPGTHLPAHTGVTNIRAIVHLPLIVPDECVFRVGGETRRWQVGEAWAFDDTIEHEAWNRSSSIRAILIFDVWNPHISDVEKTLLKQFYPIADRAGYDLRQSMDG